MHVVLGLRDLADQAATVDLDAAEIDGAALDGVAGALRGAVERAVELMLRAQRLDDGQPAIGDVCFAGVFELSRVLRELAAARSADDRLIAAERARRKMRRAVNAVLDLAPALVANATPAYQARPGGQRNADVQSALAVRRLYADFRRALRRPDAETADAVLVALRYVAGALATLIASPVYAEARASDRAVLRTLRDRVLTWARHDRALCSGLHLLEDVHTCSDLLRGINRRQELRAHDRVVIERLARGPSGDVAAWFGDLEVLVGLDDALDAAIEAARAAHRIDESVPVLLERLAQLP